MYFPVEHFGILYGVGFIPSAVCQYVIDPLYALILNGDDIGDADFKPVSIGFGIACAVSIYMPLYHHFLLGRTAKVDQIQEDVSEMTEKNKTLKT